jgi:hypothetical protein
MVLVDQVGEQIVWWMFACVMSGFTSPGATAWAG